MTMDIAIPILPAHDLDAVIAFYQRLGFDLELHETGYGGYAILTRGGAELHFAAVPGLDPAANVSGCYLRVADVDGTHAAFATAGLPASGIPRLEPPADRPWDMREFALIDPAGNLIRVGAPVR
jgi:catechol 2,3-dioxygenase-like lactoylglutathione lyase family enzyme